MNINVANVKSGPCARAIIAGSVLVTLVILLSGCSAGRSAAPKLELQAAVLQAPPLPIEKIKPQAYNHYINGLLFEEIGQWHDAADSYRQAYSYHEDSYQLAFAYAVALARSQSPANALDVLKKISPQDEEVCKLEAACRYALGDPVGTKEAYLKLVRLEPTSTEALSYLIKFYRRHDLADSLIWGYELIVAARPDDHGILNEFAQTLVEQGNTDRAKAIYRQSLTTSLGYGNILGALGLADLLERGGTIDSVEQVVKRALEVNQRNTVLNQAIVGFYARHDRGVEALPFLDVIAEENPDDPNVKRRLGMLYFSLDSLRVADSIFTDLVAEGAPEATNHFYLGRIAALQEDYERARNEFVWLTQLADSLPESWLDLGFAMRQLEDDEGEEQTYITGLNHMRSEEDALKLYFALGVALDRNDKFDSTIVVMEELITHAPDNHQAMNYLGYSLADRSMQLNYARELIERALALEPDSPAYLDSYGWVYYRLKEFDTAVEYLKRAAALTEDAVIYNHLGDALSAAGRTDEAMEWWRKAIERDPENEKLKEKLNR